MSENKNVNIETTTKPETEPKKYTIEYILEQIGKIAENQEHINDALQKLTLMESKGPGDVGTHGQAEAIAKVVTAREETNQKLIALYEKMYDDLKPKKEESNKSKALDALKQISFDEENGFEAFSNILDAIRHIG